VLRVLTLQVVQEKIMDTLAGAIVVTKMIDAQFSYGEGVLLQVSGIMRLKVRSQPRSYFVRSPTPAFSAGR
jgi:hypothetical protein